MNPSKFVVGWKNIAKFLGFHPMTVQWWHRTRLNIPFIKTHNSKQGRVVVHENILIEWLKVIGDDFEVYSKTKKKINKM